MQEVCPERANLTVLVQKSPELPDQLPLRGLCAGHVLGKGGVLAAVLHVLGDAVVEALSPRELFLEEGNLYLVVQ